MVSQHSDEIESGIRFEFGENWSRFLAVLDEERVRRAEESLREMLGAHDLAGKSFLDIGSGSGLFSLAARGLGSQVASFDYDPKSVACTLEVRDRYFADDRKWTIKEGSILDRDFLGTLGEFDIVYSWGVLHHTGNMYAALENAIPLVRRNGQLFIAIYNDQGWISKYWLFVKRSYNKNLLLKFFMIVTQAPYLCGVRWLVRAIDRRRLIERGMSLWRDMIDWIGGLPFEVAKPEDIVQFYYDRGFTLQKLKTCGGRMGCNEYVFLRSREGAGTSQSQSEGYTAASNR